MNLSVCLSVCPSVCLSVRPSVCLLVCPSVHFSTFALVCMWHHMYEHYRYANTAAQMHLCILLYVGIPK